tara:strand:- start:169 stop:381 length:213 start_codon:yes stop_codon:yes gene_type:complete
MEILMSLMVLVVTVVQVVILELVVAVLQVYMFMMVFPNRGLSLLEAAVAEEEVPGMLVDVVEVMLVVGNQ